MLSPHAFTSEIWIVRPVKLNIKIRENAFGGVEVLIYSISYPHSIESSPSCCGFYPHTEGGIALYEGMKPVSSPLKALLGEGPDYSGCLKNVTNDWLNDSAISHFQLIKTSVFIVITVSECLSGIHQIIRTSRSA